ncbi:hypothetical protein GNI_233440 [Gregarina niphandrodes]|uniref:Uncharacterized protein n=1 Tax=Gregarina niphandrodes TaxID=110365 RepID=A0A023AVG4_GRENI|nr:hypothetical protein GNI_233440 [Gregarina niphandrodes]EZG42736.1 hypothetical protein GNI_233440 [Gregarina niphandrodes]|eukprot:XP_011133986.1 hypothetical protein GNI_233440 [Gregarina niphandrodes]
MRVAEGLLNRKSKSAPAAGDLEKLTSHRFWQRDVLRLGRFLCQPETIKYILGMEARFLCKDLSNDEKVELASAKGESSYPDKVRAHGEEMSTDFAVMQLPSSKDDKLLDTAELSKLQRARAMNDGQAEQQKTVERRKSKDLNQLTILYGKKNLPEVTARRDDWEEMDSTYCNAFLAWNKASKGEASNE